LKKLIVIIPDLRGGGAEKVTVNLCNQFVKFMEVEILVMNQLGVMQKILDNRVKVHNLNIKKIRFLFFKLPKIIKERKPDIVLTQMWPLTSIVILTKLFFFLKGKYFVCEHVNLYESIKNETSLNYYLALPIIFFTHNLSQKIITVSDGVSYQLNSKFKISKKKLLTIYNPVIDSKFTKFKVFKESIWQSSTKLKLLSIGRLKKQKNYEYLIETLSLIKDIDYELIIVGEGEERENLLNLISKLNLKNKIKLIGYKEILNNYYYNADIFILPSLWEGFGNVLVEALYYNLKIISTDCKYGPKEILKNNLYGNLAPLNNKQEFAKIISKVYKMKRIQTKERALNFDVETISKQYLNIF